MTPPRIAATVYPAQEIAAPARSEKLAGWGLIAIGAVCRIVSFCFSDNAGGDAGAHAGAAAAWLQHPGLKFVFGTQPPGHFWLIGLFSLMVPDVVLAGRLLSLVCGIASLYFVWRIAGLLLGESAGIFSLAAFTFYSLQIGYSTTSSAEVPYLFFLLAATYFFFSGISASVNQFGRCLLSGFLFSISESIRFEAWIFLFALLTATAAIWIFRRRRPSLSLASIAAFCLSAGAWPIFMMGYSWRTFGDPMHLVTLNRMRVTQSLTTVSYAHQLAVMPVAIVASVSVVALFAAVAGTLLAFTSRVDSALPIPSITAAIFSATTLLFAAIETYEILTGGLLATARYTITLGSLLCILSGYGFAWFQQEFMPMRARLARAVVIALLMLNSVTLLAISMTHNRFADEFASVSPRLRYQPHIAVVARYLRSHMRPDDAVVFDDYNVESNILAEAAGLPVGPGRRAYLASRQNDITVQQYVEQEHPRFLVYSERGTLRQWIDLPAGCLGIQEIGQIGFHCAFASQVYRVYELSYR